MKVKSISENWVKKNVNPKNRRTGDCTIRAVATATGVTWIEAFDGLVAAARKTYHAIGWPDTVDAYLSSIGFVKVSLKVAKGEKRPTVRDLARTLTRPAVLRVASHMVAADGEGHFVDTWDCGGNAVYCYWIKR